MPYAQFITNIAGADCGSITNEVVPVIIPYTDI